MRIFSVADGRSEEALTRNIWDFLDEQAGKKPKRDLSAASAKDQHYADALDRIFETLLESPTFRATILDWKKNSASFNPTRWTSLKGGSVGVFVDVINIVLLDEFAYDVLGIGQMVNTTAHEYRHAWQSSHKIFNSLSAQFSDAVLKTRKLEGDANAFALTVAYELHLAGKSDAWEAMQKEKTDGNHHCIKAFTDALKDNPEAYLTGDAQNAAILAWQRNNYVAEYYNSGDERGFRGNRELTLASIRRRNKIGANDKKIDTLIYSMPYFAPDGSIQQRMQYGKFTKAEQIRFADIGGAKMRMLEKHLDARERAANRPKPFQV